MRGGRPLFSAVQARPGPPKRSRISVIADRDRQEIQTPALIGARRDCHRRPGAQSPFAPTTAADLKALLPIEPAEPLVVHDQALTRHQDVEASIAKPAANDSQLPQASPRDAIIRPAAAVTDRAPVDPERCTRPPFAHLEPTQRDSLAAFSGCCAVREWGG
jgi:hypothetical protein